MTNNGQCFSWGVNHHGQLGTGKDHSNDDFNNPERMKFEEGSRVIKLCCGSHHHHFSQMEDQSWFFIFFFQNENLIFEN